MYFSKVSLPSHRSGEKFIAFSRELWEKLRWISQRGGEMHGFHWSFQQVALHANQHLWQRSWPSTQPLNSLQALWQAIQHKGLPLGLSRYSRESKPICYDMQMTPERKKGRVIHRPWWDSSVILGDSRLPKALFSGEVANQQHKDIL